jgi:hypothetical protein
MRPASATDTVETGTQIDSFFVNRLRSNRDPRRRPSCDDRRTPTVPVARRANGCMARFTAPHALSGRGDRLAYRPPDMRSSDATTRALSSRRAIVRPTRLTLRHPSLDAPHRVLWTRRVVARPAETAASTRPVKGEQRASIWNVFHRTMAPERRFSRRRSRCRRTFRPPDDDRPMRRMAHPAPHDS